MKIKITSDNFEVNEDGTIIKKEDSLVIEADAIKITGKEIKEET